MSNDEEFDLYGSKATGKKRGKEKTDVSDRKNSIDSDSVAQDQLKAFVERIERMNEEKQAIIDDTKEIYAEAKGNGFDTSVIRQIIRIRKQDHAERMEREALLDLYMSALGMYVAPRDDDDDE